MNLTSRKIISIQVEKKKIISKPYIFRSNYYVLLEYNEIIFFSSHMNSAFYYQLNLPWDSSLIWHDEVPWQCTQEVINNFSQFFFHALNLRSPVYLLGKLHN